MLPFGNGRSGNWGLAVCLLSILVMSIAFAIEPAIAAKPKGKKEKFLSATPSASAGEQSLTNIPLPIGHEAKGLVLPDFDLEGHLRGRFEAASAKRLDEYHIGFHALKITTYTRDNRRICPVPRRPWRRKTKKKKNNLRTTQIHWSVELRVRQRTVRSQLRFMQTTLFLIPIKTSAFSAVT